MIQFGLDTFGDVTRGPDGALLPHHQVIRDVLAQIVHADELGVDAIGLGEHHRDDFAISAPDIILAAAATRTERITLGTAVTVLSSDDPIRVYERFATMDALAPGRIELTLGRGSFTESFPLFGLDLADYEILFEEKLDLFARLREEGAVSFEGSTRRPLPPTHVYPKTAAGTLPAWIGVGGSPESVVRAARHHLPMMLAIIGGPPARFVPYADLYRRALTELQAPDLPIGVHSPGFVASTDEKAREIVFGPFKENRDRIGRDRGWPPMTRDQFDAEVDQGALFVGSPETVAQKIADTVRTLGLQRFDLKYSHGPIPHEQIMECIGLYATAVVPRVRQLLSDVATTP